MVNGRQKAAFRSPAAARKSARKARLGRALYPYLCPQCGLWHLTKQKQG